MYKEPYIITENYIVKKLILSVIIFIFDIIFFVGKITLVLLKALYSYVQYYN